MNFSKGAGNNNLVFPLTQDAVDSLEPCVLHSPRAGNNHGIELPAELSTVGGLMKSALEVAEVVAMVQRGEFPREHLEKYYPSYWGGFPEEIPQALANEGLSFDDPWAMASAVHMDSPIAMPGAVLSWLLSEGITPLESRENCVDFLEFVPETIEKVANAVRRNLEMAFEVKCYYGVARPEEVLGYNMTAYPEGCPPHASFVAGHSAAAASVSVLIKRFGLKREGFEMYLKEVRDCAYLWSMQRYMAGVHHALDNTQFLDRL